MAPCERMISSASRSRSAVETPGTAAALTRSSTSATTSPAERMRVICSGVLYWICSR